MYRKKKETSVLKVETGSDQKLVASMTDGESGVQPGRYRLVLGKCHVGALARSLSPHQVRSETVERLETGRLAEIQDLHGPKGDNSGRNRWRIRRQHREAHQRRIKLLDDLVFGTINMQGANWSVCEARHVAKFRC